MTEKKKTRGQQFVAALDLCKDKEDLLFLACAAIRQSNLQSGLAERKLWDSLPAVKMMAKYARVNAENGGSHMSYKGTDGMLYMIMAKYNELGYGEPGKFKKDFAAAYPREFAQKSKDFINIHPREAEKTAPQMLAKSVLRAHSDYQA
jgi:hypothetical protein